MNTFYKRPLFLKIIALVTMIIDHIGAIFFPHVWILRLIGRVCFPLFGYLLVTGFDRTKNKYDYFVRLGIFSLISQYFYNLAFVTKPFEFNIFVTLLIAFTALWVLTSKQLGNWLKWILVIFLGVLSIIMPIEYGILGIISIVSLYFLKEKKSLVIISQIIIWSLYSIFDIVIAYYSQGSINLTFQLLQAFAPAALFIIYEMQKIKLITESWQISTLTKKVIQYGFYLFYPLHLFILYLIAR